MIATDKRFLKTVLQFVVRPVPASILTALFNFLTCYFRSFVSVNVPIVLWVACPMFCAREELV